SADEHVFGGPVRRQVNRLTSAFEQNEGVRINHQSHGLASVGNWRRISRKSRSNAVASSPKGGSFCKNAFRSRTFNDDCGPAGVRRAITLSPRFNSTEIPSE